VADKVCGSDAIQRLMVLEAIAAVSNYSIPRYARPNFFLLILNAGQVRERFAVSNAALLC
jgi:hypothetical protein